MAPCWTQYILSPDILYDIFHDIFPRHFTKYSFGIKMRLILRIDLSIIYSHQNESKCTEITEILRIVFVTSINRGNHIQWTGCSHGCVRRISTAEGTFIKKIFVHEYRKLTIILTKLTSFEHYSYPTAVIVTWKWDFIAAIIAAHFVAVCLLLENSATLAECPPIWQHNLGVVATFGRCHDRIDQHM